MTEIEILTELEKLEQKIIKAKNEVLSLQIQQNALIQKGKEIGIFEP